MSSVVKQGNPKTSYPEEQLCLAAGKYLADRGWRVVSEVPFWNRSIDIGATKDGRLILIEAKTSFTKKLRSQIFQGATFADSSIALVGTTPKQEALDWARRCKIGVWKAHPDGTIEVLVPEEVQENNLKHYRQRLMDRMSHMPEGVGGGLPCIAGQGPAHSVEEATRIYRESHPKATWDELFKNVPNHYSSATSMRSAFYSNRERRARIIWRREAKREKILESADSNKVSNASQSIAV